MVGVGVLEARQFRAGFDRRERVEDVSRECRREGGQQRYPGAERTRDMTRIE